MTNRESPQSEHRAPEFRSGTSKTTQKFVKYEIFSLIKVIPRSHKRFLISWMRKWGREAKSKGKNREVALHIQGVS